MALRFGMRKWTWVGLGFSALGLLGCASTQAGRTRTVAMGDISGKPRVEALPSLDVDTSELTAEMRMARLLSEESLGMAAPLQPADTSTASIADWSDHELKRWVQQKNELAEAARTELDKAAMQSHRQRILAGALVGLVYEDVARTLLQFPVPRELASEPEIAGMYVDLMRRQAGPYLLHARQAYLACAGNAEQVTALRHWSDFCSGREEQLPGSSLERAEEDERAHGGVAGR